MQGAMQGLGSVTLTPRVKIGSKSSSTALRTIVIVQQGKGLKQPGERCSLRITNYNNKGPQCSPYSSMRV